MGSEQGHALETILVVDDESGIRQSVRGVLADEGYRVLEAEDGRGALRLIESERPHLVILDIWMPEMDGIELLRHIRDSDPTTPVIVISGHGNIETAVTATKLGAFDFIEKPFSLDGLLHVVDRALESHPDAVGDDATDTLAADLTVPIANHPWIQRTIRRSVVANGQGLHSGIRTGLILQPLPAGSGIVFGSISASATIPARIEYVDSTGYATTLFHDGIVARTVEHLLAALHGYRITNLLVKMQGEIPIFDGSASEFCALIESAGIEDQGGAVDEIVIDRRYEIGDRDGGGEYLAIEPADAFGVHYVLQYPEPVGRQEFTFHFGDTEDFKREIAPARTFGFLREIEALEKMGLASGGRLHNCILIGENGVVNTPLRFPDEFVRHKILDIFGDFYLLGRPLRGFITARMTGHSDNVALLKVLRERFELQ
ncbi:MAG: UDP-3-O-[3-hydroxymyristoyl] N-acetylglucosamine deacetylase [Deltaproteobacteria bacterium]|nr:UDP-3-O-[3-hydroxymyristoyl] N-acetylglucosamine deacetylase [Deltaproteobacteria bacterium]